MHKAAILGTLFLLLPAAALAASSDIHFTPDGKVSAKNLTVYQKAGTNLFTRGTWGQAFIRVTIVPNASTTVIKAHGELSTVKEIREQDIIDVEGSLVPGADSLVFNAAIIHDYALQQESKTLSGTVLNVDASGGTFKLTNKIFGTTAITVGDTSIIKGARTILLADMKVGDKVISVSGTYDYTSGTLTASAISVYQEASVFALRNFEGTLKSISGTALPMTAVVTVSGIDYTVYVAQGSAVLNNAKKPASLSRFVVGDKVRFFGSIRKANLTEIDADTLRDLNF
jgi:hypothetical protein